MTISLTIKVFAQDIYDLGTASWYKMTTFLATDYYMQPYAQQIFKVGTTNISSTPYPTYPDLTTALADTTNFADPLANNVINQINTNIGLTQYAGYTIEMVDSAVGAAIMGLATVARTGDFNDLINKPTVANRSFSLVTPTLNSGSVLSTTRDTFVSYSVDIAIGATLLSASSGAVYLDYADNSSFTTNLVTIGPFVNTNGGLLGALNTGTVTATGIIPANKYRRLRTTTVSGTVTFVAKPSQEVLL